MKKIIKNLTLYSGASAFQFRIKIDMSEANIAKIAG